MQMRKYAELLTDLICLDNSFAGFLTNLIGFFLPAYFSMKALESPQPQDDIQWCVVIALLKYSFSIFTDDSTPHRLTYWVVFGFFNFIESFIDIILHFIPMYYTFKTLAIVWLMLPQTQGAKVVYTRVLRPVMANARGQGSTPAAPSAAPSAAAQSAHMD